MTLADIAAQMRVEGRLPAQIIDAFEAAAALETRIAALEKSQGKTPAKGR